MSVDKGKHFVIKHVFENVKSLTSDEFANGTVEKHFDAFWKIRLYKHKDGDITPSLFCDSFETGHWSINTTCNVLVNGKPFKTGLKFEFGENSTNLNYWYIFNKDFHKYRIKDSVRIEFHVKIDKMTGSFRSFDDDVSKESSDVVLVVGDHKFYVCKTYLSYHSAYFKSLFSENTEESDQSIIELKDVEFVDFHMFLGIIYGFLAVKGSNVQTLLTLADFFAAKIVMERCEMFLMSTSSEKDVVEKFQLSLKYKMNNLKNKCLSEMNKKTDFVGLAPENSEDYTTETWKQLYLKAVNFIK
ncbi:unnamed protein product [Caenorhabditis nigoni]